MNNVDLAIQQVLAHYRTVREDNDDRHERVYRILSAAPEPMTTAELEDVLEKIGMPYSRMSVQRSITRLIKDGRVAYKGRVTRPDVTGKNFHHPVYWIT